MKKLVFSWFDAHHLTQKEVEDYDYLSNILSNFEKEFEELEEEVALKLICDYQISFLKKLQAIN
jgi:hypothetical protein